MTPSGADAEGVAALVSAVCFRRPAKAPTPPATRTSASTDPPTRAKARRLVARRWMTTRAARSRSGLQAGSIFLPRASHFRSGITEHLVNHALRGTDSPLGRGETASTRRRHRIEGLALEVAQRPG